MPILELRSVREILVLTVLSLTLAVPFFFSGLCLTLALTRLGLPTYDVALRLCGPDERPRILEGLAEFREHLGGELTVTLLTDLGHGVEVHEMRDAVILQAIDFLAERDAAR